MQQKNLIIFMVASVIILVGWTWLQQQLFPRPKDDKKAAVEKKKEAGKKAAVAKAKIWSAFSLAEKNALLVAQAAGSPTLLPALARFHPDLFQPPPPVTPAPPKKLAETFAMGGKDFFLTVKLTTEGAGVQQVTLNDFKGADRLGLPTGDNLHLVPDDPFTPSFLLYHYGSKDDDRPVSTLGLRNWTCAGPVSNLDADTQEIRFSTQVPEPFSHLTITKIYTLGKRDYHIGLTLEIQDTRARKEGEVGPAFRYQLTGAHGLPIENEWSTNTYRNSVIGVEKSGSLWRDLEEARTISAHDGGNRVPLGQRGGEEFIQYAGVVNQYFASMLVVDDKQAPADADGVDKKSIFAWARPTLEATQKKGVFVRLAADKKSVTIHVDRMDLNFLLMPGVLDNVEDLKENDQVLVRFYEPVRARKNDPSIRIASHVRRGREPHPFSDDITVRAVSEPVELEHGQKKIHKFLLYHGPVKIRLLSQMGAASPSDELVQRYADKLHLRRLTDYGNFSWWTDLLVWCTNLMHSLLYCLHKVVSFVLPNYLSYGLSIILLTVVVRGVMFPISRKQAYLSMRMQELAPELKKLQEKYKTDPKGKNEAVMELYRKHHVHPLGGCLPLLLQLPIFMGLYYTLQESVHFRLQPFLWIQSLAAPDMTLHWGEGIPIISDPDNQSGSLFSMLYLGPYFNILPIFAVALMLVQQKMLTPPPTDEQQEMNQKVMKYMMIVIGVMFYKVAAGLCLYFIASSLWGVAERKLLPKKKGAPALVVTTSGGKPPPGAQPRKQRGAARKEIQKPDGAIQKLKDWWADLLEQARKK
jgi:YidC/Oxa1 family membrane protein insertase